MNHLLSPRLSPTLRGTLFFLSVWLTTEIVFGGAEKPGTEKPAAAMVEELQELADKPKVPGAVESPELPHPEGRVPAWAQTGKFRYARWDGGILDVVKGFLTDWPSWREPDQILACAEWYDPRNVELTGSGSRSAMAFRSKANDLTKNGCGILSQPVMPAVFTPPPTYLSRIFFQMICSRVNRAVETGWPWTKRAT
jgi:hypothetical protein